jgi:hypothetical protein
MSVSVTNTDAQVSGKTLVIAENAQTVSGLQTFDRDPSAPFAVSSNSAVVTNLDADKVDGADYAVSTWTPTIGGSGGQSGQVYTTQAGFYERIGKKVQVHGRVTLSTLGTVSGAVHIKGLPLTSDSTASSYGIAVIGLWQNMTSSFVWIGGYVDVNATSIILQGRTSAGTSSVTLAQADLSNTTDFIFMALYRSA